ncbi:MAG: U32 family peptidase [Candidatus Cloacimonetes bacterium]|nr:U32 family peptidase [Candidatus Cloacimonadota bacterium]
MELLAPAGNFEKLKYAIHYGADAVYASGKNFGLRAQSSNFTNEELIQATEFCHSQNKKIYITVNIFAHNEDLAELEFHIKFLSEIKVDAFIISDPGVFSLVREFASEIPIHISTQANVTSWKSAQFWAKLGAKRIILARELTIDEIKEIKKNLPDLELEMFVHGAMCMSYSGRCLLSSYLNARDANRGNCSQPCRWKYNLIEDTRPGNSFPIEEDEHDTYIMNSKDLNLIDRVAEIYKSGVDSIKIEGRMKSLYYVANVTRTYHNAILRAESQEELSSNVQDELNKISHRVYSEGFFDSFDSMSTQYHQSSAYIRDYQFLGEIISQNQGEITIAVRGKFSLGEEIDLIFPDIKDDLTIKIEKIFDEEEQEIPFSKPNRSVKLKLNNTVPDWGIVRKKIR